MLRLNDRGTEQPIATIIGRVLQGAWRRRFLLVVPVLVMIPLSIAAALVLPRTYVARTLLLLHENVRDNPLGRAVANPEPMRQRVDDLEALLKSDKVLSGVIQDMAPAATPISGRELASKIHDLQRALSLELVGSNFLSIQLKGTKSNGLGRELRVIVAHFLGALLVNDNSLSASQLVVQSRTGEVKSDEQALVAMRGKLRDLLPDGPDVAAKRLLTVKTRIRDAQNDLANSTSAVDQSAAMREIRRLKTSAASIKSALDQYDRLNAEMQASEHRLSAAKGVQEKFVRAHDRTPPIRGVEILDAPGRIEVIDPPQDPKFPAKSRLLFVLSSLGGSILLGIGLAWSAEVFDQRIRLEDDLIAATGVPLLGRLPKPSAQALVAAQPRQRRSWLRLPPALVFLIFMGGIGYLITGQPAVANWVKHRFDWAQQRFAEMQQTVKAADAKLTSTVKAWLARVH